MNVIIFGATGGIGKWAVKHSLEKGYCVTAYVRKMLKESDLDWTMVRFLMPQDTPFTGQVKVGFGDVKMNFAISREDIGAFMVNQVESKDYIRSMPIIGS